MGITTVLRWELRINSKSLFEWICRSLSMTGQFLTLCPSAAAISAICDYFIGATKVGGNGSLLCAAYHPLPANFHWREGHLAYKGSLIFWWIFVQINWDPLCSCHDFWQRRRDLDQILARQPALNDEDDIGSFVEVTVPCHHDGQLYFKRATVVVNYGNVLYRDRQKGVAVC